MSEQVKPIQKILFGSPGTGKSYKVGEIAKSDLRIHFDKDTKTLRNTIKTVFHPEYTYADFMGKLLPLTQNGSIIYKFYPGHFLRILGMAYKALIDGSDENFLLVIDELNRGNAAAIFGTVFQLLDRESDGWSSYEVIISDMELFGLLKEMHFNPVIQDENFLIKPNLTKSNTSTLDDFFENQAIDALKKGNFYGARVFNLLRNRRINIPSNLSIIATINTSDESIYYLDSAFKRRWDWEYVRSPSETFHGYPSELENVKLIVNNEEKQLWINYIIGINKFIKSNYQSIRRIEDKQIGWWFIKPENELVELQQVKDKLMFYLWDSVFVRDKKPLENFLTTKDRTIKLIQYSDFLDLTENFIDLIFHSLDFPILPNLNSSTKASQTIESLADYKLDNQDAFESTGDNLNQLWNSILPLLPIPTRAVFTEIKAEFLELNSDTAKIGLHGKRDQTTKQIVVQKRQELEKAFSYQLQRQIKVKFSFVSSSNNNLF